MVEFAREGSVMASAQKNTYRNGHHPHHYNEQQQFHFVAPASDRFDPFNSPSSKRAVPSKGEETPSTDSATAFSFSSVSHDDTGPLSSTTGHSSHTSLLSKEQSSDQLVHVRTNFGKSSAYVPPPPAHYVPSDPSTPIQEGTITSDSRYGVSPLDSPDFSPPAKTKEEQEEKLVLASLRREAAPVAAPWYDEDVPFDQVTATFSSLTASTLNTQNTIDYLPATSEQAPAPASMLSRKTHEFSSSNDTSSDEPVVFERNSGSRPFDERSHDFREISRVEESILEEEPLRTDEIPLLGGLALLEKSDDDPTFGLAFGGTWEAPNSPIQVFEDESPDPSSVFGSFKDDHTHQLQQLHQLQQQQQRNQQQRQPMPTKPEQQGVSQKSQPTQTAAQRRRARRHQFQFSRNMVTSDDSSMEPDHMHSLQARAHHAYFRRNRAKATTQTVTESAVPPVEMKKPIKSAMAKSTRLSGRRRRARKKSVAVSFDEKPDTVHHYISDQVHPTFSDDDDDDTVTSGDTANSDNSRSIDNKSMGSKSIDSKSIDSKGGVTDMLRGLFYFGQRHKSDSIRTEETRNNVEDDSTIGDLELKSNQPNVDNSSTNNSGDPGERDIEVVKEDIKVENNNEGESGKSSLTAMWGAVEGGVKAITEAMVLNDSCSKSSCVTFRPMDTQIIAYPLRSNIAALSKSNLLDTALEVEAEGVSKEVITERNLPDDLSSSMPSADTHFKPAPLDDMEEEESSLASLGRVRSIDDESVDTTTVDEDVKKNILETDPRLAVLARHTARAIHGINGIEFDERFDEEVITHLEFKVVRIGLPLGLLFGENGGGCWVAKIFSGSNATKSLSNDEVMVGDQLAAIDGKSAIRMKVHDICCLIAEAKNIQSIELTLLRYTGPLHPKQPTPEEQQEMLHGNDHQDESRTDLDTHHNRETKVTISSQQSQQNGQQQQQRSLVRITSVSKMFRSPLKKGKKKKTTEKSENNNNNEQQNNEKRFRWFGKRNKQI